MTAETTRIHRIHSLPLGLAGLVLTAAGLVPALGHTAMNGPSLADFLWLLVACAGLFLCALAARVLFGGTRTRTKLWALPLAVVLMQFYVLPILVTATVATNARRNDAPKAATLGLPGARDVGFRASDGVPLAGWFVPGSKPAAVVVLHGSHGTRDSTVDYIRMLHGAGYAVLAYDARGHGASGGNENAFGWNGARDISGAVAFLRKRGITRIGLLGLSMGGEESLRAAARRVPVAAVVADGAGSGTAGDMKLEEGGSPLFSAITWIGMRAVEIFSGDREPKPLADEVGEISAPVLLIASNRRNERKIDEIFRQRIGARAQLWYVADAGHTQAFGTHPDEYRQRVLTFLAAALLA